MYRLDDSSRLGLRMAGVIEGGHPDRSPSRGDCASLHGRSPCIKPHRLGPNGHLAGLDARPSCTPCLPPSLDLPLATTPDGASAMKSHGLGTACDSRRRLRRLFAPPSGVVATRKGRDGGGPLGPPRRVGCLGILMSRQARHVPAWLPPALAAALQCGRDARGLRAERPCPMFHGSRRKRREDTRKATKTPVGGKP